MKRSISASLLLFVLLILPATAADYTVDTVTDHAFTAVNPATGQITSGAGGGSVSLRSAVIAANSNGTGPHTINVPAGTYNLSASNPDSPATTATIGLSDLQIGSHQSTITLRGTGGKARIVQTTPLSDVITTGFKADGMSPAIVNLTLDQLEITGGTFTGIFVGADDGLGNPNSTSVTTITNCDIHDNSNADALFGQGGAIQSTTGTLSISNCTFSNNSATHPARGQGGAIYYSLPNASGQGSVGTLTISNCTFTSNQAALAGGIGGGAIYTNVVSSGTTISITGCTFSSNSTTAGSDGGAIAIDGNRSTDILRNTFISNSVTTTGHGGAITVNNGPTNINFNRFSGNAAATATNGNAIHHSIGNLSAVNANNNWWQSNSGPQTNAITGATVTASNWLRFTHTASPATVSILSPDNTTTLTASFLTNSANAAVTLPDLVTVIGQAISFSSPTLGTLSGADTLIEADGTATATFTAGLVPGAGGATATVNGAALIAPITVTAPDLTVSMTHSGNFIQGETGKTYTITPTNSGNANSGGLVTATISLPSGLIATDLSGSGWTIAGNFLSATRSDALAPASSYPALTLTVSVAADATSPQLPSTTISGGGQINTANDTATDSTVIISTDARLASLTSSIGSLSPGFDNATTSYILLVPAGTSSLTVTPTVFQPNATVTVNTLAVTSGSPSSSISIGVGDTLITTEVTAQDGVTKKTYTITAKTPPTLTSATYDASTGTLTATGTGMTAGDTIAVSNLTLTGEGSATYTLTSANVTASSSTGFAVTLNSTDRAALGQILNKTGSSSTGGTTYNLAAADDWDASFTDGNTADTNNAVTVFNVPFPTLTSATYNASTGVLSATGTGLSSLSGASNDINASKLTLTGEGGSTYTLTDTANVEITSGTAFTLTLSATDRAAVNLILNRNGTSSTGGTTYNLAASEDWANGADAAVVVADPTGNGITVFNVAIPTITSASYNVASGQLNVTGTGFLIRSGAANDIDLTKLTLTGDSTSYTLTTTPVEITSGTAFSATLNATDLAALATRLNKNGSSSINGVTYNLAAAEDWANGADAPVVVADLTGNGVAVSNALNLAPVVTVPPGITVSEDIASAVTGISFSDPDAGSNSVTATFSVPGGTLAATSGAGVTVGGNSSALTLTGSILNINSFIAAGSLSFTTPANSTADITLSAAINDGGNSGSGGALTDSDTTTLTVTAVNDAPTITAPGSIAITEDIAGSLTGISFADIDAGSAVVSVTLSTGSGTLAATSGSGVTVSGSGTSSLSLGGTIANINSFISAGGTSFTTASNATSDVTLNVGINDGGNSGSGGSLTASSLVTLSITAVNDAPLNSAPAAQNFDQDSNLVFNAGNGNLISVSDVDAGSNPLQVTLTASQGLVTLGGTAGLSFTIGTGAGDATMTFTGTAANINNALNGLTFTPTPGYNGPAALQVTTSDQGSSGSGGAKTDTDTISLTVDPINPIVTNVSSSTANGSYKIGDVLIVTLNFDSVVNVITAGGTPTILLETGTTDRNASYVSGSGSSTLSFVYTIQAGDVSADLDYQSTSALALNGGTIRNVSSQDAILTLPTPGGANSISGQKNLVIDGVAPVVTSVAVPADATYVAGQNLDFTVNFSEPVTVNTAGGTPRIAITLDTGGTVFADYISGTGSSSLVFRMTVSSGQLDTDGITLGSAIAPNGGILQDSVGNSAINTLNSIASTSGVLIDAVAPTVTTVTVPADGSYNAGDILSFTVNLSENVLVNTGGGTPRIALTVGASTVFAFYASGSGTNALVFTYTVQAGDNDGDGIALPASISANGGTLRDAAGNDLTPTLNGAASTSAVIVDTSAPTPSSIVRADSNPTGAASVNFTVTFSEAVTGADVSDFTLATTGTASGSIASVTSVTSVSALSYTVLANAIAGDGTLGLNLNASGTGIIDTAGNAISGGLTGETYDIDRVAPLVTSVAVPANDTYISGENLDFTVNFDEAVTADTGAGTPRIAITLETGGTVYANYLSGSGTNAFVFRMTVINGLADINGVSLASAIDPAGGTIRDALGNDADPTLNSIANTSGVLVDAVPPTVVGSGIPDQTLVIGKSAKVINLSPYFTDIGSTSLSYSVKGNSASNRASATISGNKLTIAPLANGITNITIQANDGHGGKVSDKFEVAVGTAKPTPRQLGTKGTLSNQNGLFEVTVKVANTTARPLNGFRLNVDFGAYKAAYPSLRLYNASSAPGGSKAYVNYPFPVAVDGVVSLKLSFYTSTRTFPSPFKPRLSVTPLAVSQVADTNGKGVQPRLVRLPDKNVLLEFESKVGRWYRIRFSNDLIHWQDCPVPIQAGTTRMQWIDSGPPFTDIPPAKAKSRFYRVNEITAP